MTETTGDLSGNLDKFSIENSQKFENCEEFEKWNELPVDLKLECIEKMNFGMRYQLRLTARTENQLVDSLKYKFDHLLLKPNWFVLYKKSPYEEYDTRHDEELRSVLPCGPINTRGRFPNMKTVSMLPYVLKHCDFEEFCVPYCELLHRIDFDKLDTVITPRKVIFYCYDSDCDINSFLKMLTKCWEKVESVSALAPQKQLENFFEIPAVLHAKNVEVDNWDLSRNLPRIIPLIEKWIEIDAKVGTKFSIWDGNKSTPLFDHFESRSISREESTMRIRTDNSKKHILMYHWIDRMPYFSATVVPSDIEESQYPEFTVDLDIRAEFSPPSRYYR